MIRDEQLQQQGWRVDETLRGLETAAGRAIAALEPAVLQRAWTTVDQQLQALTAREGLLFQYLQRYHAFARIEFILSVRDAADPDQEDGIWHDDGSRDMAFTLSLTPDADRLEGGRLGIRRKGSPEGVLLPTAPFGTLFLYLTGRYDFEHRIHQVTKGCRIVIAGWCTMPAHDAE